MIRLYKIKNIVLILSLLLSSSNGMAEDYSLNSVLSSGKWFKIAVTENDIYKIEFSKLKQLGLENPSNPRIFGNNNGQLSYFNDGTAPDDLQEVAVYTNTGIDGVFNEGDYLLFYGQGTNRWILDKSSGSYNFLRHNYSDTAFYFLTSGQIPGKRIGPGIVPEEEPDYFSSVSDVLYIHEVEAENLIHSGREWYQPISYSKNIEINPDFKDIIPAEKIKYSARVLARASFATVFNIFENGSLYSSIPVPGVNLNSTTGIYAQVSQAEGEIPASSPVPVFQVSFENNGEISAKGWLDYVKLHARKTNTFNGQTAHYIDSKSVGESIVTEFLLNSSTQGVVIWDVTNPFNVEIIQYTRDNSNIIFKASTDTLKTFVAFIFDNAKAAEISSVSLPNQNIHAESPTDMVILTHPLFIPYAEKLAEIHLENSGLLSLIVTPDQIYNEFSGGIPDIVAIRNFLRMKFLQQKETSHPLKYLLLFGDGSFKNKDSHSGNPNFIPTYQTQNSNIVISSFTSDDFYSLLEDGEGEDIGTEDLGIGRIPVSDTAEAGTIVSKIERYLSPSNRGDWKNVICITADDEDGNTHMYDAEGLADIIKENAPWVNIEKIYFDAFKQITTSTGQFYPDVTQAINDRINSGILIFNYIGHGNELSLGHERVVTPDNLVQWKNIARLPLFITATCEFSRFDDIIINNITEDITGKYSSGERLLLDQDGGAIALMSTTRLVYSAPNYALNRNIFAVAFDRDPEVNALRLGDIIRMAKIRSGNTTNKRNFVLLGDPALRLSYPWHGNIVTDSINNLQVSELTDTLKALSVIAVSGHIEDNYGNQSSDFNGIIEPLVFGQPSEMQTLANDGGQKMNFKIQDKVLFSGKTKVEAGRFKFNFIVPRDIDYSFGQGKISYYAFDTRLDMNGCYSDIVVGGFSNTINFDTTGPVISLYLNDTLFRNGGITGQNPTLLALIEDESGINISGTGIGHDLVYWLDEDKSYPYILNNYYENDLDTYSKGRIIYKLSGLTSGRHSLTLKAWDNYNNSSVKSMIFQVDDRDKFILKNLYNYPNPFISRTQISFEHNRPDEILDIIVTIFSMNGEIINIKKISTLGTGYQLLPIEWDGKTSGGKMAAKGIYPYRVNVRTGKGEIATISGTMIIY